jgi:hypothetical protein
VNGNARQLVGQLLVKAADRLEPDDIVGHPFIVKGTYLEDMRSFFPAIDLMNSTNGDSLFQQYCRLAGVGRDDRGECWPRVGTEESENCRERKESVWSLGIKWAV